MRVADIVTSLVLAVFALFMFGVALGHIRVTLTHGGMWYQSAGLFPAIVAGGLFLCAVRLFFDARRELPPDASLAFVCRSIRRHRRTIFIGVAVFGWLCLYMFLFIPVVSYVPGTFLFLVGLLVVRGRGIVPPVLVAAAVTAVLYGIFAKVAMIPLP